MSVVEFNMDFTEVVEEYNLTAEQAMQLGESVKQAVTAQVLMNWQNLAKKNLKSTRRRYLNGLRVVEEGRLTNTIVLKGKLNNMIEAGISSFDMKLGFANSSKAKRKKDGGWYLTIPFRHATEGALGESEAFSSVMPKEITKLARERAKSGKNTGLRAEDLPRALQTKKVSQSGYKHKNPIYEGLKRTKTFSEERDGVYVTFRRVSDKSAPKAFIHPGFKSKNSNFAEKALNNPNIQTVLDNAVDEFVKNY